MAKLNLSQNSLFQKKIEFSTKEDIVRDRIERFGDRIVVDIPLANIEIRPQVRRSLDEALVASLSEEIQQKGIVQPVTVMKKPGDPDHFILVVGGDHFRAFERLARPTIPCIVKDYADNLGSEEKPLFTHRPDKIELQKLVVGKSGKYAETRQSIQAKIAAAKQFIEHARLAMESLPEPLL